MNAESYSPPLTVHVFWSPRGRQSLCAEVGRALYEFLCRPLQSDLVGRPGAGIPVRLGQHGAQVRAAVEEALKNRSLDLPCLVAVPLLESASRIDRDFRNDVAAIQQASGQAGWPRVLVLPVLLDESWSQPNDVAPGRSARFVSEAEKPARAVEEVSMGICHFLMDRGQSGARRRVQVFISHTKSDLLATERLAERLRDHINTTELKTFFDANDVARGRELTPQLAEAGRQAVFLSLRTDGYSESPWCLDEVLVAKKHGVPTVCVHALSTREQRSLAYGGNVFTYVRRKSDDELEILTAMCLQAWLRHLHFLYAAPAICRMRQIGVVPHFLSRSPELIDFAQNLLPRGAALVVYPDPPLPQAELGVIASEYPKVRLATPSTLDRELLRRDAAPTLEGSRIALSLSDGPDLPTMAELAAGCSAPAARGLTDEHVWDVTALLTWSLVRAGAALGYGGDHRKEGYTEELSGLIEAYKRTTKEGRALLFNYIAAYLYKPEMAERILAEFIEVTVPAGEGRSVAVRQALELAEMRKLMAVGCDARVIMGGKTLPRLGSGGKSGYSGRIPGQAEEAWRHMEAGKPVYVIGGFGGCGRCVADAICGKLDSLPAEDPDRKAHADFDKFCAEFDCEAVRLDLSAPGGIDGLWAFFAKSGEHFFHGQDAEGNKLWHNGLSVAENRRLFDSTHPEEITALVHRGLRRRREAERKKKDAPLQVMLFRGSIADATEVECYAVVLLKGGPLRGADRALDDAMEGAIGLHLGQSNPGAVVAVKDNRLAGDFVILHTVDDLAKIDDADAAQERQWFMDRIRQGVTKILEELKRLGLRSVALVPFFATLGVGVRDSVSAMLEALVSGKEGDELTSVTLCEIAPEHYAEILQLKNDVESTGSTHALARRVVFTELRSESIPVAQAFPRPAILLEVQRTDDGLTILSRAPWSGTVVAPERKPVNWKDVMTLTHALGKGVPPGFDAQRQLGVQLAALVLPAQAIAALTEHPDTPIDILHDVEAAAIPFELLCFDIAGKAAPHWPAIVGGIRRCLLKLNIPPRRSASAPGARRRILLIADPRGDLAYARTEAAAIRQTFAHRSDVLIDLLIGKDQATRAAVIEKLKAKRYDILHFAGHAIFNARAREQSGLLLAGDELLSTSDLIAAQLNHLPTLVVLNACEGGRVRAAEPEEFATCDASVAETIIAAGVQGFIGNLWKVRDDAANTFSALFYAELDAGRTLGEAVLSARRKLFDERQPDWLNYMLYGQADLRI